MNFKSGLSGREELALAMIYTESLLAQKKICLFESNIFYIGARRPRQEP